MQRVLILTGNQVHHNFLCNSLIFHCKDYEFTILKTNSCKTNFEYYYSTNYSAGIKNEDQQSKDKVIDFIFDMNRTLCSKEHYDLLKAPKKQQIVSWDEFHNYLKNLVIKNSYDLVLTYSSPIIKNKEILEMKSFNLHFGLSRFYGGGPANLNALASKEFDKVGVTCHKLNVEIDAGDALFEVRNIPIEEFNNYDQLNYFLLKRSVNKMISILNKRHFDTYRIPKGRMILNQHLSASMLMEAQENIKNFQGLSH